MNFTYPFTPSAAQTASVCTPQTRASAGNLIINGTLAVNGIVTLGEQAHLTLYSYSDLRGLIFTITGISKNQYAVVEDVNGPNACTIQTLANFYKVTQISVSGDMAGGLIYVGNANNLETAWMQMEPNYPLKALSVELFSADFTYEVQYSPVPFYSDIREDTMLAFSDQLILNKTASCGLQATILWRCVRLKIKNYKAGTGIFRLVEAGATDMQRFSVI